MACCFSREMHLMRDDEHRHAVIRQSSHYRQHLAHQLGIERACHLIEIANLGGAWPARVRWRRAASDLRQKAGLGVALSAKPTFSSSCSASATTSCLGLRCT